MCAEDAKIAIENGIDGIYVSNHGARQLDTTPATIEVLKALALGADIVWIGRPILWALACEGQTGVENMIRILNEELKEAMLSCGVFCLEDIKKK